MGASVEELEDEIKLLKNEIKTILQDIREYLQTDAENPFSRAPSPPPERKPETTPRSQAAIIPEVEPEDEPAKAPPSRGSNGREPRQELKQERVNDSEVERRNTSVTIREDGKQSGAIDLLTMALLSRWVQSSITKLGKEPTMALVEVYEMMGGVSPLLKRFLNQLVHLASDEEAPKKVTIKDSITALEELDNLFWQNSGNRANAAILSRLLSLSGNGNGNGQEDGHR
ncbi:MAG: hypothetical protein HY665_07745 [Chloroflexi bacterium]|nr:hypothetical protein [Chloroflexota bacterium]